MRMSWVKWTYEITWGKFESVGEQTNEANLEKPAE